MARSKSKHGCQKARSKQIAHRKMEAIKAPPRTKFRRKSSLMSTTRMDAIIKTYNKTHVAVDKKLAYRNQEIAEEFVNSFRRFLEEKYDLHLSYVTQGSSYEDLKIGAPDEYDFLLLLDDAADFFARPPPSAQDPAVEKMKDDNDLRWALNCYHRLVLEEEYESDQEYENSPISEMLETWPETGEICLSSRLTIKTFHRYLLDFIANNLDVEKLKRMGVHSIPSPECRHPALKTVINLDDETKITIDMSMAVRFPKEESDQDFDDESDDVLPDTEYVYYLAKKKPSLNLTQDKEFQMLWLDSFSQDEKELIKGKRASERRNLRIVKSIFSDDVQDKYIWKTLFMKNRDFPESATEFILKMITDFVSVLTAEKEEREKYSGKRLHKEINKLHENCDGRLLLSAFNNCENVLERYDDGKIGGWLAIFTYYQTILQSNKNTAFLLSKPELALISEKKHTHVVYAKIK